VIVRGMALQRSGVPGLAPVRDKTKAPLYTKLTLMDCGIGNTNLLGSSSSGLGYDCFYMKSTDGATMYFNLGSGIGSGRFQTDY